MKNCIIIALLCLLCSINCYAAVPEDGSIASPLASYVFHDADAAINMYAYGGSCGLNNDGRGTLTITLQYQSTYDNSWKTFDEETSSKTFYNTSTCAHSENRLLTTPYKYRCKTYVSATVGNHWDEKTVYSPVLTIY